MKRWIALVFVVISGIAALAWSVWRPVEVQVSPAALLYFIGDTERELSRLPVSLTRLSDQEEIDIGNRLARYYSLDSSRNLPPEQARQAKVVADYLSRVGGSVAARAHRKLPYRFHYIRDMDFVNAFALPGGHVYIGAGLVALMDTEDKLAAVLGHEIEHIDHYHCAERVQLEARLRKIPLGELLAIPATVFEAGYSKDQELEADREGTRLAVWAGYSPHGAIRMFETFERLDQEYVRRPRSPQEELSMLAAQTIGGYFRSHPPTSERVEQIRKLIADKHWQGLTRERDLEVDYIFWTERAWRALQPTITRWRPGSRNGRWSSTRTSRRLWSCRAVRSLRGRIFLMPQQPSVKHWTSFRLTRNCLRIIATRWRPGSRLLPHWRNSRPCLPSTGS